MNAKNFDAEMCKIIEKELRADKRPKLLLHACCAPCSSACLERLKNAFDVTVLFYNPNIVDGEYEKRKEEIKRFISATGWADFLDCDYDGSEFFTAVKGLEACPEGGSRCEACFALRLEKTAVLARSGNYDYFATTLTLSPLKDAAKINGLGYERAQKYGVNWLPSDFKKRDGYLRSIELSKNYSLYRQNFCGCIFSQNNLKKL